MPTPPLQTDVPRARWLTAALGFVAVALPFGLAVTRAASSGQWRDDISAVRDVGLVAVGVGGGLSTLVTQALGLLPLGSKVFRASLGSTLALALAARLLFVIGLRVLSAARAQPHLAAVLAAIATLTAALSPTWQREATVGGGALLAVAAGLGALALALECAFPADGRLGPRARGWIGVGALLGATFAESPPAGVVTAGAIGALLFSDQLVVAARRRLPWLRRAARADAPRAALPAPHVKWAAAAAAVLVALLLLAPLGLRPFAPRAWIDLGRALSMASLTALDVASARTTALAAWTGEIGLVSLAIAAVGVGLALTRGATRCLVAPLVVLVVADTVLPARVAGVLSADPLTSLRSLAVGSLAVASALGVAAAVSALLRTRVPMAKSGAVLLVVFHLTLVALASEEAGFIADRSQQFAAEEWTDEAYVALEPSSAILVRSPAIAWRLWAARLTRGERPDIVVIPIPLLDRGRVATSLLALDRRLEPLLRDFALSGEPSEFALSKVADARPLHVQLDRGWSRRLLGHLAIDGMWLEYLPQPLGPSDRKIGAQSSMAPVRRVLAGIARGPMPDASTASVVSSGLREQAAVLGLLGEHETAQVFLDRVALLAPTDPLATGGSSRFAFTGVGRRVMMASAARR